MDRDEFDQLGLWSELDETLRLLSEHDGDLPEDSGRKADRLRFLTQYLLSYRHADPAIFTEDMPPHVQWSTVNQQLTAAFAADEVNEAQLEGAVASAQGQYSDAVTFWPPLTLELAQSERAHQVEAMQEIVDRVRRSADEAATAADTQQTELREQVEQLKQQLSELSESIKQDEARLDTALTENNEAFTAAQSERSTSFNQQVGQLKEAASERFDAAHAEADEVVQKMQKLLDDTEKVGGKVAQAILARDHGRYANREYFVGIAGYVIGFVTVIIAIVSLWRIVDDVAIEGGVSWSFTALRLALTGLFGAASAVALRFGAQAMRRAEKNKRSELELRALTPLLSSMSDEVAQQVRKDFIARSFGQREEAGPYERQEPALAPDDVVKILEAGLRMARQQPPN